MYLTGNRSNSIGIEEKTPFSRNERSISRVDIKLLFQPAVLAPPVRILTQWVPAIRYFAWSISNNLTRKSKSAAIL